MLKAEPRHKMQCFSGSQNTIICLSFQIFFTTGGDQIFWAQFQECAQKQIEEKMVGEGTMVQKI